jgi:hypothetical protein
MIGTRLLSGSLSMLALLWAVAAATAQDAPKQRDELKEPMLRLANRTSPLLNVQPSFDSALMVARKGLEDVHTSIHDYSCTVVKRELVNGTLMDFEYMAAKIRNRKVKDGKVVVPFSVYLYFLKPANVKGREVLYVEGTNSDKMIAHEGGPGGKWLPTVWIKPNGTIAMRGQRYPLTEIGIENLILKLIERGEKDQSNGMSHCEVTFHRDAKINGRTCTMMQFKHPKPAPNLDFHLAQVFIDDELQLPIRYAAYAFPSKEGEELPVTEEYTYVNLKLNVGLTDEDFDHTNKKYAFK